MDNQTQKNINNSTKQHHRVLTIAGSDSGGGAGIQADLKTFSALGCFGMSVITALTAQNTVEVRAIESVSPSFIATQIEAVLDDIGVDAVKIGMLHSSEVIATVAKVLQKYSIKNIVLDPVMVAKSGDHLLRTEAIQALKELIIPLATVVTPNLPEASILLNQPVHTREQMLQAARELKKLGSQAILVKGGHLLNQDSSDVLVTERGEFWLEQERIDSINTHGTGCTFSSAIASYLSKGLTVEDSVRLAKEYLTNAIIYGKSYQIGRGHGAVQHFFQWWE